MYRKRGIQMHQPQLIKRQLKHLINEFKTQANLKNQLILKKKQNKITKKKYRQLTNFLSDQTIFQEINNNNSLQILKNIIPFSVKYFEYFLRKEMPQKLNLINLIESVRDQKQNFNQNKKNIKKFQIQELKELIKYQNFVQEFSAFLGSKFYEEQFIDNNKRISKEKKQSYKIASKMVLDELNKPVRQKFQGFLSEKNRMLKENKKINDKANHSQIGSEYFASQKDNYDQQSNFMENDNNFFSQSD